MQHAGHQLDALVGRALAVLPQDRVIVVQIGDEQRDVALVGVLQQHLVGAVVVQAGLRVVERLVGELLRRLDLQLPVVVGGAVQHLLALHQELLVFLGGHGPGEVIALHDVATHLLQGEHLLGGLHALGDGGHLQGVGDVDHRIQHLGVLALLEGVAHELHVQLQRVHGQRGDHVQGGIAAAEVVHLDVEARVPKALHRLDDLGGILGVGGLGDLQQELVRRQIELLHQSAHVVHQVVIEDIHPAHVHGHRYAEADAVLPVPHLRGHRAPHIAVQRADEAVALEQGDEVPGADHAQLRVLPAHQGLGAVQHRHGGLDLELRLVVDHELLFFDGLREVQQQLLGVDLVLVQLVVVDGHGAGVAVAHGVRGQLGPVEPLVHVQGLVHVGIDAHAQVHPAVHAAAGVLEDLVVVLPMGTVDQERVALPPTDDAAVGVHVVRDAPADPAQHVVAVGLAVPLVDHVEVADVHQDGVHGQVLVVGVVLLGVTEEELLVVQAGELVALGGADDVAVFGELDGMADPGQQRVRAQVRRGDEIHGPAVEKLGLHCLVIREDDDGNAHQLRVLVHLADDVDALHVRKGQLQQHQAHAVLVGIELFQHRRARGSGKDHKAIGQHPAETLAALRFPGRHQNLASAIHRSESR